MTSGALIAAEDLRLSFGGTPILERISLKVLPNQIFCVAGPNGSGKTTLIRALLGLLRPDSGKIHRKPGLTIGYVPQTFAVDPSLPLTVRRLLSLTHRPSLRQMEESLEEVGASGLLDHSAGTLSGGERQRVLLARALLRSPELLVLDEPIQNVDFDGKTALYRLITQIRDNRGLGILMISHDLGHVMEFADDVIELGTPRRAGDSPVRPAEEPARYARTGG